MIKKAIIPLAGYGTRMLPASYSLPKTMLNVFNKPVIEYIIDELKDAGITDVLMLVNSNSNIIEKHFTKNYELEHYLKNTNNEILIDKLNAKFTDINIFFKTVNNSTCLAETILQAESFINDDYFMVVLGDEIFLNYNNASKEMINTFNKLNKPLIGIKEIESQERNKYGIIEGKYISNEIIKIDNMIEKPNIDDTTSNIAIVGRYILPINIFDNIKHELQFTNNNSTFTNAIFNNNNEKFGFLIKSKRFDCGSKLGLLLANLEVASNNKDYKQKILQYFKNEY